MKLLGKILELLIGPPAAAPALLDTLPRLLVSIMFREAIMISISHSWKRSTTSAQVSWNRLSFSIFLNTVDLISTN